MKPFAVITARAGSKRVKWKNMLPINGRTLAQTSIHHAIDAGLDVVVTSDIEAVTSYAKSVGAFCVKRPTELADGNRHFESIRHAVNEASIADPSKVGSPVVLLQPTSPFRNGNIIQKCLEAHRASPEKAVLSGRTIHYADASGSPLIATVWDGCVAVYPYNDIRRHEDAIIVENEHGNMLQVDSEEDYIQACVQSWRQRGRPVPIGYNEAAEVVDALSPILKGKKVTVVGRTWGQTIDQSRPVVWLNHCVGWDGQRADALVVVASKNIVKVGINRELAAVAASVGVVIIRDFGQADWVLANLKTSGRVIVVKETKMQVSTGAMACLLVHIAGGYAEPIGFQRGVSRIMYCHQCFPNPCVSDEIAMIEISSM